MGNRFMVQLDNYLSAKGLEGGCKTLGSGGISSKQKRLTAWCVLRQNSPNFRRAVSDARRMQEHGSRLQQRLKQHDACMCACGSGLAGWKACRKTSKQADGWERISGIAEEG